MLLLAWGAVGCGGSGGSVEKPGQLGAPADLGPVVARVGDSAIFAAQVSARAQAGGITAPQALEELISLHLRAARARASGLPLSDAPPEILAQRLLEREFEVNTTQSKIPLRELRAVYERNIDQFVHPRLVRVALLSVWTGPRMKPEPRARNRSTAHELWNLIEGRPDRATVSFEKLAAEERWASRQVKYAELWQALEKPHGPAIGKAVQALRGKGELTGLLEDETGYHIARYLEERPAEQRSFQEVESTLRERLYPSWRQQKFVEFTRTLERVYGAEIFARRLDPAGPR